LLTVTQNNCTSTSQALVPYQSGRDSEPLFIPNVFTPNGDKINDLFEIKGLKKCANYNLQVYNRWGELIFNTEQPSSNFWNGKNPNGKTVAEGTYFYMLTSDSKSIAKGMVAVITK
jgi:gliding motility-associated-like protein